MKPSKPRSSDEIRGRFAALLERAQSHEEPVADPRNARDDATAQLPAPRKRRGRGRQKAPTKVQISIRLDPDVLEALRAGGKGWQSRLNATLRDILSTDQGTAAE